MLVALAAFAATATAVAVAQGQTTTTGEESAVKAKPSVRIYGNSFSARGSLGELRKLGTESCARRTSRSAMSVRLGRKTSACAYRTPVIGRNLDIAASVVLSSRTPSNRRARTALGLTLRGGEDTGDFTLSVRPNRQRWSLTREMPGAGGPTSTTIAHERDRRIHGTGKRNRLRLQAFDTEIIAWVNGKIVARYLDPSPAVSKGRQSSVAIGTTRTGRNIEGSFDSISVRVPVPR